MSPQRRIQPPKRLALTNDPAPIFPFPFPTYGVFAGSSSGPAAPALAVHPSPIAKESKSIRKTGGTGDTEHRGPGRPLTTDPKAKRILK